MLLGPTVLPMLLLLAVGSLQGKEPDQDTIAKSRVVPIEKKDGKIVLGTHELKLNDLETLITRHALAMLNEDWDALFKLMVFKDGEFAGQIKSKSSLKTQDEWRTWLRSARSGVSRDRTPVALLLPPKSDAGPVCVCCSYYLQFGKESKPAYLEINLAEKIDGVGWKIIQP